MISPLILKMSLGEIKGKMYELQILSYIITVVLTKHDLMIRNVILLKIDLMLSLLVN